MTIDGSGLITWATSAADIAGSPYTIEVQATNPAGLTAPTPLDYTLTVVQDTQPPVVQVVMSSDQVDINSVVSFQVIASDNVGVTSLGLTVGGTAITLDGSGRGQFTPTIAGPLAVVATAGDAAGLTGTADASLDAIDPNASAPTVAIASPSDQAVITAPVEVTGAVNATAPVSWTLEATPVGGTSATLIQSGTSDVASGGNLGLFDPTNLPNGAYVLTLTAWGGGLSSSTSITVNIKGYLKLGNLHLSFNDLTVPVAGIPITITRTYDSLYAGKSSDFGYGWTLSESNYQLSVDAIGNGMGTLSDGTPFEGGTRVLITKPNGTVEGFTFDPQPVYNSGPFALVIEYYAPYFRPDPGVTDTLAVPSADLSQIPGTQEYYVGLDDYNPANPAFGDTYTLTDQAGLATTFAADTGQVLTESDRHGNTLTFQDNGIFSNTGRAVTFVRDSAGRITSITDPNGNSLVYAYTATGDLQSVTDRDGHVTSFGYSTTRPHFLTAITDAMGHTVMSGVYDGNGRLTSITNATDNSARCAGR